MRLLLRINFVVAVWLCIALNAYQFWGYTDPAQLPHLEAQFSYWLPRAVLAPLLLACGQLFLWFQFYRFDDRAARIAAAWAGTYLAIVVLVQLLRLSIDYPISASGAWLYTYFAASHLAYAILGRRADGAPA